MYNYTKVCIFNSTLSTDGEFDITLAEACSDVNPNDVCEDYKEHPIFGGLSNMVAKKG